jgi:antirestriction protein ArdC
MLWAAASAAGYPTHQWMTYRQAQALGGHVRKGERGTMVVFWKVLERAERNADGELERTAFPLMRSATVFNIAQVEGVRLPKRAAQPKPVDVGGDLGPVGPVVERLALEGGLHHGGNAAFYSPGRDSIQVPQASAFTSLDAYRVTLLHECGHSTGHANRLKREFGGSFGDAKYAFEELVAELVSAFASAALGVRSDLELHASYLDHWSALLKAEPKAFVKACSMAQAAADYLVPPVAEVSDDADSDDNSEGLLAAA